MGKKVLLILLSLIVAVSFLAACSAPAPAPTVTVTSQPTSTTAPHPETSIDVFTAGFGFFGHVSMLGTSTLAKKVHPWLRVRVAETPGYVYNAERLEQNPSLWDKTIIEFGDWGIYLARNKIEPFTVQVLGLKKLLSPLAFAHFLVSTKPGMDDLGDVVGKKLALGTKAQSDYYSLPRLLMEKGWGNLDQMDVQWVGHMPAMQAMMDGLVDVVQSTVNMNPETGVFMDQPIQVELKASGKKLYYLKYATPEVLAKFEAATGLKVETYTFQPGAWEGLDQEVTALISPCTYTVKDVFPEELAYEFVKLYIDNYKAMEEYNKFAVLMSPGMFTQGLTKLNTHPGALRAYEEAGIAIPEK